MGQREYVHTTEYVLIMYPIMHVPISYLIGPMKA